MPDPSPRRLPRLLLCGLALLLPLAVALGQPATKPTTKPATKPTTAKKAEDKGLVINDTLTRDLPMGKVRNGCHYREHPFRMEAGATYTIDLIGHGFDAYLRVADSTGKSLAEDDDSGGSLNSRIIFTAPKTD